MKPNTRKALLDARRRTAIARLVSRCSQANRANLEAHIEEERNLTRKELSIRSFATAVVKADGILQKSFRGLTVEDARRIVSSFRPIYSPASLRLRVISFRRHLRLLFQVKRLDEQGSLCLDGKAVERALSVPRTKMRVVGQVISRDKRFRADPLENVPSKRKEQRDRSRWSARRAINPLRDIFTRPEPSCPFFG